MEREEKDGNGMDGWKRWRWRMDRTALPQLSLTTITGEARIRILGRMGGRALAGVETVLQLIVMMGRWMLRGGWRMVHHALTGAAIALLE